MRKLWLMAALIVALPGCASRLERAESLAANAGLQFRQIAGPDIHMASWVRNNRPDQPLTVYIEGDGLAYGPNGYPSTDPTPKHLTALAMAVQDGSPNVAYLARPCQFVDTKLCSPRAWTTHRFSDQNVSLINDVIGKIARPGQKLHLVGYSGGAAISVIIAGMRPGDVLSLTTVAGNLDPYGFNQHHRVTEVLVAPDVLLLAAKLDGLPQRHFVGDEDKIVPRKFAESFVAHEKQPACAKIVVANASHLDGWSSLWPDLLKTSLPRCAP